MAKWRVGNKAGYNANMIYDEDDNAILEVFGVQMHTKVADAGEGRLVTSRQIAAEHNAHEQLVLLADEVLNHLYDRQDMNRLKSMAKEILKTLGRL